MSKLVSTNKKRAIFVLGGPAAGKSHITKKLFSDVASLDPDEFMAQMNVEKGYEPNEIHNSIRIKAGAKRAFETRNALLVGQSFVYQSTGWYVSVLRVLINLAKNNGYYTEAYYVETSLKKALERNKYRDRVVPEEVVRLRSERARETFCQIKNLVDKSGVISNEQSN